MIEALAAQQRQRRRRLHRALRRAVSDPRARARSTDIDGSAQHRRRASRRRADPHRRCRRRRRSGAELRTGAATENGQRGRARHRVHAGRREQPRGRAARRRAGWRRSTRSLPAGRARATRSTTARRWSTHHRDGREEPARGRAAGHRRAVPAARQHPRGADHGGGHPALHADDDHRHGAEPGLRQSDEPGRARLRPDRRWRGDHRRELPAPLRRGAARARPTARRATSASTRCVGDAPR